MLKLFVISYQTVTGKTWESERCAYTAREALASFHKSAREMKHPVAVLGIIDANIIDGRPGLSLRVVA